LLEAKTVVGVSVAVTPASAVAGSMSATTSSRAILMIIGFRAGAAPRRARR
jgi:hypothetical protein